MSGYGGVLGGADGQPATHCGVMRSTPVSRRDSSTYGTRLQRRRRFEPGCGRLPHGQRVDLVSKPFPGGAAERRPLDDGLPNVMVAPARGLHRASGRTRNRGAVGGVTDEVTAQPRKPRGPHEETERSFTCASALPGRDESWRRRCACRHRA